MLRKGTRMNLNGHTAMQKIYILAMSKVRRRVRIKNSWNPTNIADDKANV
jgi:hypothetical protein